MDIFEAIKKRRSIRGYKDKPVEEEKLIKIIEAAREAPSASNRQEWRFVVAKDSETRKELCVAAKNQAFVAEAPVVIACCALTDNHVMTCGQLCYPIDVAIAIDHMTLAAAALGLGTCWVGAFREEEVKRILAIPSTVRVVELLTLGYPRNNEASPKERLPLCNMLFSEKWNQSYL
ncbi:MAG: nitroreductase family protein [Candidatus Omnitrophota bacterium]